MNEISFHFLKEILSSILKGRVESLTKTQSFRHKI
jgi:hypothetical protein